MRPSEKSRWCRKRMLQFIGCDRRAEGIGLEGEEIVMHWMQQELCQLCQIDGEGKEEVDGASTCRSQVVGGKVGRPVEAIKDEMRLQEELQAETETQLGEGWAAGSADKCVNCSIVT